jgi:hypothetical protein
VVKKMATAQISRAVSRLIEPGNNVVCAKCGEIVKFLTREQARQVIANVYAEGKWLRVEHWHETCYAEAEEPYGPTAA